MNFPRPPLLWIPRHVAEAQEADPPASQFVVLTGGWGDLFGTPADWEHLLERLRRYSLGDVLNICSKISAALLTAGKSGSLDFQVDICLGLFGDRGREILDAANRLQQRLSKPVVLFTEMALVNLAKVAILQLDADHKQKNKDLSALGEALLMIGELCDPQLASIRGPDDTERTALEHYALANTLFNQTPNPVHAMARAFELYFSDQQHLHGSANYCNLPERIERLTGLEPQMAWNRMFALAGHWAAITPEQVSQRAGFVDRETYLTSPLDMTRDESEKLFDLVSIPYEKLAQLIRLRYSLDDLRWFDVLPLAANPLVDLNGLVFAPSAPLLFGRLFDGLHHLHLDQQKFSERERARYLSYMGTVFEDYVERLLDRAYPPLSGRFIRGTELIAQVKDKVADGLVLYGDSIIVLEAKAVRLTADVRYGADPEGYEDKIRELVLDALEQLYATIRQIQGGEIQLPGGLEQLHFYPVIISLEPFPLWPMVYRAITDRANEAGIAPSGRTQPWQLINVDELEIIETAVHEGLSLLEFLRAKTSRQPDVGMSVTNFIHANADIFGRVERNAYLEQVFNRISSQAVDWVKSLSRDEV